MKATCWNLLQTFLFTNIFCLYPSHVLNLCSSFLVTQSSRVSETLSHGGSKQHSWKDDEANHEKEEFHNIFKEVQQLGDTFSKYTMKTVFALIFSFA